jgi:hypothetical protein
LEAGQIEPTHKGFAEFDPSLKPLKMLANSVECSTEMGPFFHGFSPYWQPFWQPPFMPSTECFGDSPASRL